jgi:hypothetical protein
MNEHVTIDKVWISAEADAIIWYDVNADEWRGYFIKYGSEARGHWDIKLPPYLVENFSTLPARPCADCDGQIVHGDDYLCDACRNA